MVYIKGVSGDMNQVVASAREAIPKAIVRPWGFWKSFSVCVVLGIKPRAVVGKFSTTKPHPQPKEEVLLKNDPSQKLNSPQSSRERQRVSS
jgi:hypothetical protein